MYLAPHQNTVNYYGLKPLNFSELRTLVKQCAQFIHFLNYHGFIYGDLSAANILVHGKKHTPLFIDCDGIMHEKHGLKFIPQPHTPGWFPPENIDYCTKATDTYKLCLLIIRLFDQSPSRFQAGFRSESAKNRIIQAFGQNVWDMVERGGSDLPQNRPSSTDVFRAIKNAG